MAARKKAKKAVRKKPRAKAWFVYMLECAGGRIYTGVTPDVLARYALHCSGKGAAFTRGHKPQRILAARRCAGRGKAQSLEYALKQLKRPDKLEWAQRWAWMEPAAAKA